MFSPDSAPPARIEQENRSAASADERARTARDRRITDALRREAAAEIRKKKIWLAGGCFWGSEAYFKKIPGVLETEVGYANGESEHPSYEEVCTGSGHAEVVAVTYDANRLSLFELLCHFFRIIDPFSVHRQGNDIGIQYRTGIYYLPEDKESASRAARFIEDKSRAYARPLAVEVLPLRHFTPAEAFHQDYLEKHPDGYCHIRLDLADTPLFPEAGQADEQAISALTPLEYEVTQKKATEAPFSHPYDREFRPGIYVDIVSGRPLFVSDDKFHSGCGWPAFSRPISEELLRYEADDRFGCFRIEVLSKDGAHLGHVFSDGPREQGGLRYCINGSALRFIPCEEMEKEGYGAWKALVAPPSAE